MKINKLSRIHPHKKHVVRELYTTDRETRVGFPTWCVRVEHDGEVESRHFLYSAEYWLQLGLALPEIVDGGMAPNVEGSCEYIE
jgi:hypothetical protein